MNEEMSKIAEEIIRSKMPDATVTEVTNIFYEFARKNNVRMGTLSADGRSTVCDNPEWTMCKTLFLDTIKSQIEWSILTDTPEDLDHY